VTLLPMPMPMPIAVPAVNERIRGARGSLFNDRTIEVLLTSWTGRDGDKSYIY